MVVHVVYVVSGKHRIESFIGDDARVNAKQLEEDLRREGIVVLDVWSV